MNRLVIIGNGFDLAHGLKTSYNDFINWYWEQRILGLKYEESLISEDILWKLEMIQRNPSHPVTIRNFMYTNSTHLPTNPFILKNNIEQDFDNFKTTKSPLFERITKSIETKGWTDIESDYYELLKKNADKIEVCKGLNDELDFLRQKLAEYLKTQTVQTSINEIASIILHEDIDTRDIAITSERAIRLGNIGKIDYKCHNILLLDFNYTPTTYLYLLKESIDVNHIHGTLNKPQQMIFGYGDEMDRDFQQLIDQNENELLKNSKSTKYLETDKYRSLLQFIEGDSFQVCIMGHSCGNSDRTLLNTIFEHKNCISIKPFCYKDKDGKDNYSELTMNIYRNFNDKALFRDRVVNKKYCTTLEGESL